jgi:hypothetical protein
MADMPPPDGMTDNVVRRCDTGLHASRSAAGQFFRAHQVMMMDSKSVLSALRRDVSFVWNAVIGVVFIGFASLAVAATVLDVIAIRH